MNIVFFLLSIQVTFLYPALLCSRTFINPTLLFNRIARAIFSNMTRCSQVDDVRDRLSLSLSKTFTYHLGTTCESFTQLSNIINTLDKNVFL